MFAAVRDARDDVMLSQTAESSFFGVKFQPRKNFPRTFFRKKKTSTKFQVAEGIFRNENVYNRHLINWRDHDRIHYVFVPIAYVRLYVCNTTHHSFRQFLWRGEARLFLFKCALSFRFGKCNNSIAYKFVTYYYPLGNIKQTFAVLSREFCGEIPAD